ncbi:NAD-binding protein [Streptomyces sp. NPDC005476]|uniref:NAD-binding protein n=1 Tax=Streptomyces sp. NPDC005476 TaxID=3156882 RepID=UPI0034521774
MVGGDADDFAEAKPVFEALGRTIAHCGPNGRGQTVKAANQLVLAINPQACAEAVVFLEKSGVDLEVALDVLGGGLAGSNALARKKDNFLKRDYTPSFRMGLHHKDLGIVTDTARAIGAAIPLGSVAAQFVASAVARGEAELDHSALLRGVELLSGYDHDLVVRMAGEDGGDMVEDRKAPPEAWQLAAALEEFSAGSMGEGGGAVLALPVADRCDHRVRVRSGSDLLGRRSVSAVA